MLIQRLGVDFWMVRSVEGLFGSVPLEILYPVPCGEYGGECQILPVLAVLVLGGQVGSRSGNVRHRCRKKFSTLIFPRRF